MKAGETQEIIIELNLAKYPAEKVPHDWSVVVWGENGPVTLTHQKGYKSQHLPVAPAKKEGSDGPAGGPAGDPAADPAHDPADDPADDPANDPAHDPADDPAEPS